MSTKVSNNNNVLENILTHCRNLTHCMFCWTNVLYVRYVKYFDISIGVHYYREYGNQIRNNSKDVYRNNTFSTNICAEIFQQPIHHFS